MALYHKYRPGSLEEFVGNESVVDSVCSILSRKRSAIPHAWMFTGPSGCGKTTLARIIASILGAHETEVVEINFAATKGIDTVRDIISKVGYKPSLGKSRVWILDEFHEATTDAQNAILKVLEEPPSHVYMILATTDPHKLIATVKNRLTTYNLDPYSEDELSQILKHISKSEGKKLHPDALSQIVTDSIGSARMAINIMDKIIDLPLDKQKVSASINAEQENQVLELCRALMKPKGNWKAVYGIVKNLKLPPEKVRQSVLPYMSSVILNSNNARAFIVMEAFHDNFFYDGKSGLTRACYMACNS